MEVFGLILILDPFPFDILLKKGFLPVAITSDFFSFAGVLSKFSY